MELANWDLYSQKLNISGTSTREIQINAIKNSIINDFESLPSYRFSYINNSTIATSIQVIEEKNPYIKTILMLPDDTINVGDIFDFDNEKWLCTEANKTNPVEESGKVQKTNNTLKFYNKSGILCTSPCIINKGSISDETNKFLTLAADEYMICVPYSIDTSAIIKSVRFIISGEPYKTIGTDKISQNGLLWIRIKEDTITANDNVEENIADYYSHQTPVPVDNLLITLTPSNTTLMLGRTLELTAHAFVNEIEDFTKFFLYTISNADGTQNSYITTSIVNNICTITSNKTSTYSGKYINIRCELLGEPTKFVDRQIKLVALI